MFCRETLLKQCVVVLAAPEKQTLQLSVVAKEITVWNENALCIL